MSTKIIKPFDKPKFTPFSNDVLDYIMPNVSPNAWKVICFAMRQTIGWHDKRSPSGRRLWDTISVSQFMQGTGIASRQTAQNALDECLAKKYLKRRKSRQHLQSFQYQLNEKLEIEVPEKAIETVTETVTVEKVSKPTVTETVTATVTETVTVIPQTVTETVHTKEKERNKKEKKRGAAPPPAIEIFRKHSSLFPAKECWEDIISTAVDLDKWDQVCCAWKRQGNKKTNVQGRLDWYNNGIPDYARPHEGGEHASNSQRNNQRGLTREGIEEWKRIATTELPPAIN